VEVIIRFKAVIATTPFWRAILCKYFTSALGSSYTLSTRILEIGLFSMLPLILA